MVWMDRIRALIFPGIPIPDGDTLCAGTTGTSQGASWAEPLWSGMGWIGGLLHRGGNKTLNPRGVKANAPENTQKRKQRDGSHNSS